MVIQQQQLRDVDVETYLENVKVAWSWKTIRWSSIYPMFKSIISQNFDVNSYKNSIWMIFKFTRGLILPLFAIFNKY